MVVIYESRGKIYRILGKDVKSTLRHMVEIIGEKELGIKPEDGGTNSNISKAGVFS